jgi:hypothetical protein
MFEVDEVYWLNLTDHLEIVDGFGRKKELTLHPFFGYFLLRLDDAFSG